MRSCHWRGVRPVSHGHVDVELTNPSAVAVALLRVPIGHITSKEGQAQDRNDDGWSLKGLDQRRAKAEERQMADGSRMGSISQARKQAAGAYIGPSLVPDNMVHK